MEKEKTNKKNNGIPNTKVSKAKKHSMEIQNKMENGMRKDKRARKFSKKDFEELSVKDKNKKQSNIISKNVKNKDEIKNNKFQNNKKNHDKKVTGKALCPYAEKCGSCNYQGISYEEQLKNKEKLVKKLANGMAKVEKIVGMKEPFHYRNKVHAVFDRKKDGTIISGIYEEKTHRVVNVDQCLIEDKLADEIIFDIRGLLKSFKITVYNEISGRGLLRHVCVRRGFISGEVMVILVVTDPIFPSKNNFVKALRKLHPEISTVVLNINDKETTMVLGQRDIVIYGKGYITDTLCGCNFKISPQSFYQINPIQTENLYNKAISLAQLTGNEKVIDAYCGIGTIGMVAAKNAKEVIGVELNKEAIKDAHFNAKINKQNNIEFCAMDAGDFMVDMAEREEKADVVFMDPPRSGSDEKFLASVVTLSPKKIVYISCNPETMVRDMQYLNKQGYVTSTLYPFDMFPFTSHVEVVAMLEKK